MGDKIRNFFNFRGRMGRLTYFLYSLTLTISVMILCIIAMIPLIYCALHDQKPNALTLFFTITAVFAIGVAGMISAVSIMCRRFHDLNMSGFWVIGIWLWSMACAGVSYKLFGEQGNVYFGIISYIPNLLLLFIKGTDGSNSYGMDPTKK